MTSSPPQIIRRPPGISGHNTVSCQREMLSDSQTLKFEVEATALPWLGSPSSWTPAVRKGGALAVSFSISHFCTALSLLSSSCSTGLPLSFSGWEEVSDERRGALFLGIGSSGLFRDFLMETSN